MTDQKTDKEKQLEGKLAQERLARALERLADRLVTEHGLDRDYAELQAQRSASRIRHAADGGTQVVGDDGQVIVGDASLNTLTAQIAKDAPAKFRTGKAAAGGAKWDKLKADIASERARTTPQGTSAAERLGMGKGGAP